VRSCRFLYYYRQRIQNGRNIQLINIAVEVIKDWAATHMWSYKNRNHEEKNDAN
jgi:hypothetical protein